MDALEGVPGFEWLPGCPELDSIRKANRRWLRNSDEFFAYQRPNEFTLRGPHLQFPSAVKSLYQENDTVYADLFPLHSRMRTCRVGAAALECCAKLVR